MVAGRMVFQRTILATLDQPDNIINSLGFWHFLTVEVPPLLPKNLFLEDQSIHL